ncbi:MAG TPA: hypothetical protein VFY13_03840 [Luteolibacter sp.]|nr:hypothetical protein [Luteolibacter sp.]
MKPRTTLAETPLPDGSSLCLQEHDGRLALLIHGQQICGPATRAVEEELARLACAPFRPARQPKILLIGLGLGQTLGAVGTELKQKRGSWLVAEPMQALVEWHRRHLPDSPLLNDSRAQLDGQGSPADLIRLKGQLHAILLHLDFAPMSPRQQPWVEDRAWLAAAHEALQDGGLLAIAASRRNARLPRLLARSGFEVAEHEVVVAPNAKRQRLAPVWLARKGGRSAAQGAPRSRKRD